MIYPHSIHFKSQSKRNYTKIYGACRPRVFNLRCKADRSIPTNFAVLEIFPPNFFNCVVLANTNLNELDVLKSLHEIEHNLGRKRRILNEARIIDLDLIDYSNKILISKEIVIPHPRAHQRRFVMEPLAELDKT